MQGLLLLNKPQGKTSFGAVAAIKRLAGEKRVGHTGTLDPLATGVLPILLGRATTLSGYLLDAKKRYTADIQLGTVTDTDDITGEILAKKDFSSVTAESLLSVLENFKGDGKQTPPIYSAIKKDGVRLYSIARQGKTAEVPERDITVYSISLLHFSREEGVFTIDVKVSKGTYIRALARDIGVALGCGATVKTLCRTETGSFSLNECTPLDELTDENIKNHIVSEETVVSHLPQLSLTEKQAVRFCNGGQISFERLKAQEFPDGQPYRMKCGETFLGIGEANAQKSEIAIRCIVNRYNEPHS